jgi:hypothetical protein
MNANWSQSLNEKRLKVFCVGNGFVVKALPDASGFPAALLAQTDAFDFECESSFSQAHSRLPDDLRADLLLIDTDGVPLDDVRQFVRGARRWRPSTPIIAFSHRADDRMRYLMLDGLDWHFTKRSRRWHHLAESLSHVRLSLPAKASAAHLIPNPYVVGRPLAGAAESLFVGRGEVFTWLAENLLGATRPNTLLLMGRRRIGKTSTLYQLVEGSCGRLLRQNHDRPIFPIYIDLQRFAGRSTDDWLRRLASDIYRKAPWSLVSSSSNGTLRGEAPYTVLERCFDLLEKSLPPGGIILLAVDEVEQVKEGIESGRLDPALLAYLRSQLQHRPRIAFLLCGSRALRASFWHPIFKLAVTYELDPLTHPETVELIRRPISDAVAFDEAAVEVICRRTDGHPYLVQAVCHRLITLVNCEQRGHAVSVADVAGAIEQLIAEGITAGLELSDLEADNWRNASPMTEAVSW